MYSIGSSLADACLVMAYDRGDYSLEHLSIRSIFMAWIKVIPEDEAEGDLALQYSQLISG